MGYDLVIGAWNLVILSRPLPFMKSEKSPLPLPKVTQFKTIRRRKPHIGPVRHPVPDINVEAFPPFDPLFNLFRKMGMAKENDLKSLQKFLMGKGVKRLGAASFPIGMIDLATLAAHFQRDATAHAGTHELNQPIHPVAFDDGSEESILPLPGIRQISMSDKGSLPTQLLLPTAGVNLNLHSKPVREQRLEKEVVISFNVLDPNPHPEETLETLEYRKVFRKRKRCGIRPDIAWPRNISKSEKKLEEVTQNHEMPHPLPLGIQESKKRFHPFPVLSGKMSVGDENPVLFGTNQCVSPSSPHTAIVESQAFHLIGVVNVPEIDKDGGFQEAFYLL
jgi:hypothetical protein